MVGWGEGDTEEGDVPAGGGVRFVQCGDPDRTLDGVPFKISNHKVFILYCQHTALTPSVSTDARCQLYMYQDPPTREHAALTKMC